MLLRQLRAGPVPTICVVDTEERSGEDSEDEFDEELPELSPDDSDDSDDPIEDGDRIFYTAFSPSEDLRATSTVSQRLAEAYAKNSAIGKEAIPEWAHEFEDVFNRESFDSLLERRTWDHAIELVPDSKPANCKVYPIELDAFIEEGLATGWIRPSKSPMASPVFFVKKKDGALRFRTGLPGAQRDDREEPVPTPFDQRPY